MAQPHPPTFVTDLQEIRRRVRVHREAGAPGRNGARDVATTLELLNDALATQLVCVLRYTHHATRARDLHRETVKGGFGPHARAQRDHALRLAERIHQLGGRPDFAPRGLRSRGARPSGERLGLGEMIREGLVIGGLAIDTLRELARHFAHRDPTTRRLLEDILSTEEAHAHELHALWVAHAGRAGMRH